MNLFQRPHYRSEATDFLDALKKSDASLEARQREGRALLWDKPFDAQARNDAQAAKVPQKAYVYQTNELA
jgi:hypothetical protein